MFTLSKTGYIFKGLLAEGVGLLPLQILLGTKLDKCVNVY